MELKVRNTIECEKEGGPSYDPPKVEIVVESHPDFGPNYPVVIIEIDGDRYVMDGRVLIAAVRNAMNLGSTWLTTP